MAQTRHTYKELEVVPIPDGLPELGIEAGTMGTVVDVLAEGRLVTVDVVDEEGRTLDLIDVYLEPAPHVIGRWRLNEK
jgi:hypothetical protein